MTLAGRDERGRETAHGHMETKTYCVKSHHHITCGLQKLCRAGIGRLEMWLTAQKLSSSLNYSPGAFLAYYSFVLLVFGITRGKTDGTRHDQSEKELFCLRSGAGWAGLVLQKSLHPWHSHRWGDISGSPTPEPTKGKMRILSGTEGFCPERVSPGGWVRKAVFFFFQLPVLIWGKVWGYRHNENCLPDFLKINQTHCLFPWVW